ncbi:MAG: 4-hydroxy-tetrahydrodipicolinate synthase [Sedimentibacter saalensis]|uniref:4-hydroxy-tetrahydrodipicolinate synthase n=1 Tax=Sedimentibacter saalensis TaxID=130788 RepID=UPI002B200CD3|nr:4-hydroxy-tetrahydrodipicolinate synthase [Sedimentibacter saalensis]MEA5095390.1 4-hydroxy-tetrahydrodipicolinate synthase [Sedimentibacter saalensis]
MVKWGRLITAMVTPFDEELNVDFEAASSLAIKLVEEGSTALVVTGTTGEAPTLTEDEKINLYKIIKASVDVPVIAGVGTNNTKITIENAKAAQEAGVDGLLVVTPYYNKPDQDSLYCHFKEVAESVDLPIMLYNVPGRTGCNILPETVEKLAQIDNIKALKEASGNIIQFAEIIKRVPENFLVYSGDDSMLLPAMSIGCYGVVSVASHVVGPEMKEMIDAFISKDTEKAKEMHLKLLNIFKNLFVIANPIPVKAALNLMGVNVGGLRLPLTEARENVLKILREDLNELGKI